ncbi:hypothetical protein CMO91_01495 [Candidatus Woesearchaeota archaeon]|nr:hypothetical protein [Candidatus Woesearchaeota archaeon]
MWLPVYDAISRSEYWCELGDPDVFVGVDMPSLVVPGETSEPPTVRCLEVRWLASMEKRFARLFVEGGEPSLSQWGKYVEVKVARPTDLAPAPGVVVPAFFDYVLKEDGFSEAGWVDHCTAALAPQKPRFEQLVAANEDVSPAVASALEHLT